MDPVPGVARPEPSRGYRWLVLAVVSLGMFGNYYVFDAMNPVGPLLEKQLGFNQSQIGLLDSAYNAAALIVLIAGGLLIDRVGTKRAMIAFGTVTALGGLLIALSPTHGRMMAGRFVLGLGAEPFIVGATTVLGRWFKGKEMGFAMAMNLFIARLGSAAADSSADWAAPLFSEWQRPLLLAAAVGAACMVASLTYALLERNAERRFALGRSGAVDRLVPADLVRFDKSYWWVVGLCVAFYSVVFPFRRFANIFFIDAHGAAPEIAGRLNGLLPLTAMFATPLFGLLVDRYGRRALLMAVGSLLLVPTFLIMAHTRLPLELPVAMMGVSFSLIPAVMWPSVTFLVEEKRLGTAYALMTFCQQIGWAAMAWAVGRANDAFAASAQNPAGYAPGMWLFASMGLLGLAFSVLLWRAEKGPRAHGLETVTTRAAASG